MGRFMHELVVVKVRVTLSAENTVSIDREMSELAFAELKEVARLLNEQAWKTGEHFNNVTVEKLPE